MSNHFGHKSIFHIVGDATDRYFVSGTASDFTYRLDLPPNNHYNRVAVVHANLNKSWYVVESGKNQFTLTEENGTNSATVTIPVGNYTRTTLLNTLPGLLNTASPNGYTYSMSYSNVTGKYTYTCTGHTLESGFNFSGAERIHKQLGFDADSSNAFSGGSLESTNVINFQFTNTINIRSNMVAGVLDNILQEIAVGHVPYRSMISYDAVDLHLNSKELMTNASNIFRFVITDAENHLMDLGGLKNSIHMTLVFYRRDDTSEKRHKLIGDTLRAELDELTQDA